MLSGAQDKTELFPEKPDWVRKNLVTPANARVRKIRPALFSMTSWILRRTNRMGEREGEKRQGTIESLRVLSQTAAT
jgi:hypothetical protein